MKKCACCHEFKGKEFFWKSVERKDGLCKYCICCSKNKNKITEQTDNVKKYRKAYRDKNIEKIKINSKIYYHKNSKEINKKFIIKRRENPSKYNTALKQRKEKNPLTKLSITLRDSVYRCFKKTRWLKTNKTAIIIGCDYNIAKKHIERQFKKGMTWQNHGKGDGNWNIDHIMPLASAKNKEDLIILCHYTNLRPMWSKENIQKGAKIIEHQMKITI